MWVRSLGWEDPLEESMATHSSILAWRIPMNRGAWWATVHSRIAKSWPRLTQLSTLTHTNKESGSGGFEKKNCQFQQWTLWVDLCLPPTKVHGVLDFLSVEVKFSLKCKIINVKKVTLMILLMIPHNVQTRKSGE